MLGSKNLERWLRIGAKSQDLTCRSFELKADGFGEGVVPLFGENRGRPRAQVRCG